jgi:hypothetical protein
MVTVAAFAFLVNKFTALEKKTSEKKPLPTTVLNPGPTEFKPGAHLTRPRCSVNVFFFFLFL